jgi:hypothetical protein
LRIGHAVSDNKGVEWTRETFPEFQIGSLGFVTMLIITMGVAIPVKMVLMKRHKRK